MQRLSRCLAQEANRKLSSSSSLSRSNRVSFLTDNDKKKLEEIKSKRNSVSHLGDIRAKKINNKAQENAVPTTRVGRVATFAPLVTRLAADVLKTRISDKSSPQNMLSKATTDKMVETLSRARGAALKIGQMLSIQDDAIIPKHVSEVFERVRQSADYMPFSQVESQLIAAFGKNWEEEKFQSFEKKPFAAASIGQVHRAVTKSGQHVAVKIQYPNVANSIDSDVENLKLVLPLLRLPESFYPHDAIQTAREELIWETDYIREAECQTHMRKEFENDEVVKIPKVESELSSKHVLTAELILNAITLDECLQLDQETRNFIARQMIRIGFKQLFSLRFMQTDPNWSNYFWDPKHSNIWMIDFGAAREYSKEFIDDYRMFV